MQRRNLQCTGEISRTYNRGVRRVGEKKVPFIAIPLLVQCHYLPFLFILFTSRNCTAKSHLPRGHVRLIPFYCRYWSIHCRTARHSHFEINPHPLSRKSVGEILCLTDELILDPCLGSLNATCRWLHSQFAVVTPFFECLNR